MNQPFRGERLAAISGIFHWPTEEKATHRAFGVGRSDQSEVDARDTVISVVVLTRLIRRTPLNLALIDNVLRQSMRT
ncbi:MAG: hypothetical protein K9N47_07195 [Prosthecobacter sp.]|uniref:hypothetical protein n=1 Tax=Prosthecobacter sp. TaxID=1965333 RepID=UPI002600E1FA|nr:hypothetical protein [Prosthecobacter sp.]MCF7785890.1 hypothetical protein [Prosthecobacter sp.]